MRPGGIPLRDDQPTHPATAISNSYWCPGRSPLNGGQCSINPERFTYTTPCLLRNRRLAPMSHSAYAYPRFSYPLYRSVSPYTRVRKSRITTPPKICEKQRNFEPGRCQNRNRKIPFVHRYKAIPASIKVAHDERVGQGTHNSSPLPTSAFVFRLRERTVDPFSFRSRFPFPFTLTVSVPLLPYGRRHESASYPLSR